MDVLTDAISRTGLSYTDSVVALGAAVLGLAAGVLGVFAVLRERSLVGDALAHATLPGVCVAFLVAGTKDVGGLLVGAGAACIVGALAMVAAERVPRITPDTAIGVVLASFFSLGIVLLTHIAHDGSSQQAGLEKYLFGQAAGLQLGDVRLMLALAAAALVVVALVFRVLKATLFDPAFAAAAGLPVRLLEGLMTGLLVVAVIIGVRTVGAILMVSLIVAPAVAARQLAGRLAVVVPLAGAIGAAVGVAGSLAAAGAEVPTGPVITLVAVATALLCVTLAPGRGILWHAGRLRRERRRALVDGVLLDLEIAVHAGPPPTVAELADTAGRPRRHVRRAVSLLERTGLVATEGGRLRLTPSGAAAVHAALEGRRLWTAWLDHGSRLGLLDAREPDPRDLRGSLGDDAVDALERMAAEGVR